MTRDAVMMSAGSRGLEMAALVSWLLAESLGAYMLRSWLRADGARRKAAGTRETGAADAVPRQETVSLALILGHAGLALGGLASWVSFVLSGLPALAWLAVGLLAPAIGLGISTVTIWTPYPARPPESGQHPQHGDPSGLAGPPAILVTNEILDQVLANEALTSELVDDLVERMLAEPPPARRANRGSRLAPVIPVLHGGLALTTFLLAVLAAISASA
ncbi:MAG TPA: hypothetical protein VFW16_06335 [Streptosporangiaceae bacterium]|nr:hypothetical protein [Streptosporangiaceae bacterium]